MQTCKEVDILLLIADKMVRGILGIPLKIFTLDVPLVMENSIISVLQGHSFSISI